jgi:hypothetical protein
MLNRRWLPGTRSGDVVATAPVTALALNMADPEGRLPSAGVVTVTLHPDALKTLLTRQVEHSDLGPETKLKLAAELQALDAEAFAGVARRMLEASLVQARAELHLLRSMVG